MVSLTIGASLAKMLFPILGPTGTTLLRLSFAAIILLAISRPWRTRLARAQWKWISFYGAILGLMNCFFYLATERLPIGLAIGIEFLGPLAVAIGLSRTRKDFVWALLALTGVALILPRTETSSVDMLGVVFALTAAFFWAAYILVGKQLGQRVPAAAATSYGMAVGALVAFPIGLSAAIPIVEHLHLIPIAIAVGILSSAIPYSLEMTAMKNLDSKTFGILLSLEPAIGALSAFALLSERLTALQVLAIACVIAASIGSTLSNKAKGS